ncbi:MAG TPA: hypothetical protein VH933_04150 [Aestuariivirgaceae bacterium]|jgi:hypothetical protein
MIATASFLEKLERAADNASACEKKYRREASETIKTLERERAFAFRRLNLMRALTDGMKNAETSQSAVANALAILRAKLGWSDEESDARSQVCEHFVPVAQSVFASLRSEQDESNDLAQALEEFEAWYAKTHSSPFWMLLEHHMTETPRVDF